LVWRFLRGQVEVVATGNHLRGGVCAAGVGAMLVHPAHEVGLLAQHPYDDVAPLAAVAGAPEIFRSRNSIPTTAIVIMLGLACLLCAAMLNARIRAREVVRG